MKVEKRAAVLSFLREQIQDVLAWYMTGAVDCPETCKAINADLDWVLSQTMKKFNLRKKFDFALRARSRGDGVITVRYENSTLC